MQDTDQHVKRLEQISWCVLRIKQQNNSHIYHLKL